MNIKVFIYVLLDQDGFPIYVGKSERLESRIRGHRLRRPNMYCHMVLEITTREEYIIKERYWIKYFRDIGFQLENKNSGGSGAVSFTEEQKAKVRAAVKGRKQTEETKAKISASKQNISSETRAKLSAANKGRKFSESHKASLSRVRKGKIPKGFAKMQQSNIGRKFSDSHREKIKLALKGHTVSDEAKKKIGAAQKGKVISPEQRQKQSEFMKGRGCLIAEHNRNRVWTEEMRQKHSIAIKAGKAKSKEGTLGIR